MKFKQLTFAFLGILCLESASAQELDYQTLHSSGPIPPEFTEKSSDRYYRDLSAKITKDDERFARQSKESFYLNSSFNTHQFLTSGKVLFNDEVSIYLNKVLDELLNDDPALRKQLRVYTVKSPAVNAYTVEAGIIFVNLGLLARLNSEAQLAFILSHELVHYKEKHMTSGYMKEQEISASKGDYKHLSFDEKVFSKSRFDKDQELEADKLGLEVYLKSRYEISALNEVFDMLKHADDAAISRVFTKEYLESSQYKFPEYYYLTNVKGALSEEDYDDSKSSHPNIAKRKEALQNSLSQHSQPLDEGQAYIVSQKEFNSIRKIAQFELSRSYLLSGEVTDAFLNAYAMEEHYPGSMYLHKNVLKSLYHFARFGYQGNSDIERGERQRLAYFFKDFSPTEMSALSIKHLYQYFAGQPDDEEVELMLIDLVYHAVQQDENFDKRFSKFGNDPEKPLEDREKSYVQFAFSDFDRQAEFFTFLENYCNKARNYYAKKKRNNEPWKAPAIDKTLVINPIYLKVDTRKKQSLQYEDAESVLTRIDEKVERATDELGIDAPILNTLSFNAKDVDKFNTHSVIQEWLLEKMRHETPASVSPIHNEVKVISEAYGTNYFTWMGGISLTQKRPFGMGEFYSLAFPALYFPSLPLWAYHAFKPKKNSFFFSFTFDVRNEGVVEGGFRKIKMKDNESLLQSNIYYTFFELKY